MLVCASPHSGFSSHPEGRLGKVVGLTECPLCLLPLCTVTATVEKKVIANIVSHTQTHTRLYPGSFPMSLGTRLHPSHPTPTHTHPLTHPHTLTHTGASPPRPLPLVESVEHCNMITGPVTSKFLVRVAESLLARWGHKRLREAGARCNGAHCITDTAGEGSLN